MVLTQGEAPPPWRDPPVLGLMLGQILVWSAFSYQFPALAPFWAEANGWSLPQVMGALTVAVIAMALVTPLAGRAIDRGHGAVTIAGATLCGALALVVVGSGPALPLFYAAWLVIGIAMGATLYEPVFAILLRARGSAARGAITGIAVVAGFASLLTFPLCQWLTARFGLAAAPLTFAALVVVLAAPALTMSARMLERETPVTQPQSSPRPRPANAQFRGLIVLFMLPAFATGLVLSQILPLLTALGFSTSASVALAALMGPVQVAARLATSVFASTTTRSILAVALGLLCVGAMSLGLGAPTGFAAVLFLLAFGAGNGLVGILRAVFVSEVVGPEALGAQAGAVARAALLAVAAAPILGAALLTTFGPETLLAMAFACTAASLILLGRLRA